MKSFKWRLLRRTTTTNLCQHIHTWYWVDFASRQYTTNPDSPRNLLDFSSRAQKRATDVIVVGEAHDTEEDLEREGIEHCSLCHNTRLDASRPLFFMTRYYNSARNYCNCYCKYPAKRILIVAPQILRVKDSGGWTACGKEHLETSDDHQPEEYKCWVRNLT